MAGLTWDFVWWAVAGALMLGGLQLLWLSLFYDRSRGRRRCPKCWYNLEGHAKSRTCPECGRTARSEGALYRTRRSLWPAGLAAMCFIGTATISVSYMNIQWQQYKPLWILTMEMHVDGERGRHARREILSRGRDGRLSTRQRQRLADHVLSVQADPTIAWGQATWPPARDESWAAIFEDTWHSGELPDQQVRQYLQSAFEVGYAFHPPAPTPQGEPIRITMTTGEPRLHLWQRMDKQRGSVMLRVRVHSITYGSNPPMIPGETKTEDRQLARLLNRAATARYLGSCTGRSASVNVDLPPIHEPGEHDITAVLEFAVMMPETVTSMRYGEFEDGLHHWQRTEKFVVMVLPP